MSILQILLETTQAAAKAADLYAKFNAGEMTEAEAVAAWKAQAEEIREAGTRFDELTR